MTSDSTTSLTYADYLHLPQLLSLQQEQSDPPEHDEFLFIVIHQTYELWFAQLLHTLDRVGVELRGGDLWGATHHLGRMRMILKTLVGQVDILETMTPRHFTSFRNRLDTASGFQSMQFREVEFRLGIKRPEVLKFLPEGLFGREAALRRFAEPGLVDDFHSFLVAIGVAVPPEILSRDVSQRYEGDERMQELLVQLTQDQPAVGNLTETLLDIDEGLQEWRYRHVQLVRRTIGAKHGTGGSPGVGYLRSTVFETAFPDLWAIRHRF